MVLGIKFRAVINVSNQNSNHMFDTGTTGFMLVATSLVMLMTPGLAFFYGGLVGQERPRDHDPELCFDGLDHRALVHRRLLALLQRRRWAGIIGNLDHAFMHGRRLSTHPSPGNHICRFRLHRLTR